jgi:dehydrogenase/reductase SDR family protein 12
VVKLIMNAKMLWKTINFYGRFTPNYTKIGYYTRRTFWGSSTPLDFSGQQWLITGGSAGLGKAMVHAAANAGADVIAVGRSQQHLDAAIDELAADAARRVSTMIADMSLQSATQRLLDMLLTSDKKIDVLMNNVGVLLNEPTITNEGRETSFAVNILSHFLLTEGLADNNAFNRGAVVVNMTSGGMYNAPLGIKGLNTTDDTAYDGKVAYAFAKRAQVSLTPYWNNKYADKSVRFYVTHPGWAKTPGVKQSLPTFWKIQNIILRTPRQGADTALWLCATRPEISAGDNVWFDRKSRPAHMYETTKTPLCTVEELADYLRAELT